ncbi:hypothetical protein D9619_003985 [Psilocybe cf. subviscida]|uniref:Uncharacterized protein n=1 Tax=Psilocybe cf. subviscida TaxID=2480587 RepID=A0A8H5BR57_9AGAR|nr:hypothetical protein D9619_003985 [Psilocybe cf. subviscida]
MEYVYKGKEFLAVSSKPHTPKDIAQAKQVQSRGKKNLKLDSFSPIVNLQLQEENARLHDENAELREQVRLTAQQLTEAMTALARAMKYIQHIRSATAFNRPQIKKQTLRRSKECSSNNTQTHPIIPIAFSRSDHLSLSCDEDTTALRINEPVAYDATVISATSARHEMNILSTPEAVILTRGELALKQKPPFHPKASLRPGNHAVQSVNRLPSDKETVTPREQYENWLTRVFITSTGNDILQRSVWEVYQETFPKSTPNCPLSTASGLLTLLTEVFPQARCMSIEVGAEINFIVRGLAWNVRKVKLVIIK